MAKSTTHLKTSNYCRSICIEHLYDRVSAWHSTRENLDYFKEEVQKALTKAKETQECVCWDHDGWMFLQVTPGGCVNLCTPVEKYVFVEEGEEYPPYSKVEP